MDSPPSNSPSSTTVIGSSDDYDCCAKEPDHDGWCRWVCSECDGTGKCPECADGCHCDDVIQCELCDGLDACGRCGGTGDVWDE